jgi:hypothetical protein
MGVNGEPVLIERTGKKYKNIRLQSIGVILLGFVLMAVLNSTAPGWYTVLAGCLYMLIGEIGAWYAHG